MRQIPAEVAALLKSRSMIGSNKPSCEVTVEGLSSGLNSDAIENTIYTPIGTSQVSNTHASSIEIPDGRILVVYSSTDKISQGYATSASALFANNSVSNITDLFTGLEYPTCILHYIDAGLFLSVAWKQQNLDKIGKVLLYNSAIGDGSDWALHATIQNFDWSALDAQFWNTAQSMTKILKIENRYIIQCPLYKTKYSNLICPFFAIYDSVDLVNWNLKFEYGSGVFTTNSNLECSSNFIEIDGNVYFAYFTGYGGAYLKLIKSSDGFNLDQSVVHTIQTDYGGYRDLVPYKSCVLKYDNGFLYIIGVTFNSKLIFFGCDKNDITDLAKYKVYKSIDGFAQSDTCCVMYRFANGSMILWAEDKIIGIQELNSKLPIKNINISRNKNMAGSLNLSIDNKNGDWSPDNTINQNVLFPNKEITVKQGYGTNLIQTFTGLIDRIEMTTFPQELKLSVRDKLKLALDQTITWTDNATHVILFQSQPVETIFSTLCGYAGLTTGTIEATGLTITKTFSWETYADCFSFLADLVGFEYGADETGLIYFRKDTTPAVPVIAYEFSEGEDIISLGYTIDDNDLYSKVVVYGKDENDNVLFAQKEYVSKDYYNVLSQKFMKIDVSEASTVEQLQSIADRAEMLMRSRVREVSFAAIAVPWLQVGDIIRVTESSTTISELYRITDLSTNMDSNGYTMQITCYHHSA